MDEIDNLRHLGMRALVGMCWLGVLLIAGGTAFATTGYVPLLLALGLTAVPTMMVSGGRTDAAARLTMGATLPLYPALLLYQWSGSTWMIDLHMSFFAVIAMLAILADWRPIIAGAGVTAVHHLVLNFAAPSMVFGATGDLGRVVLHAVVVIAETAVLVALANRMERGMIEQAEAEAEKALLRAQAEADRDAREAEQQAVVNQIGEALRELSQGNLSHRIHTCFPANFEGLRSDFNRTVEDLEAMVGNVAEASQHIQSGASEIRVASDDLARRTEQQAASVEQANSTMHRLVAIATETAQNAASVNDALASAQRSATEGEEVVGRAMATMELVERSANEIRQIISLIDGIAFQTNLLALNAGVEAARAGESGKGFAVVATEVRALAQRSADAANSIKALIDTSTTQVAEGVTQVMQTGEALRGIMEQVVQIGMAVDGIAQAATGNAADLRRVNETFGTLDQSTQQNAAMVEESTAALGALANETNTLMQVVSRFRRSMRQIESGKMGGISRAA
ncbi:methyl-accepting chemotaxis protein [Novosphingobium sp. FSY-8]|uniref:Methyl-accepting chemotaxis protein n=1 Tax=Novosphingobium ovatum TaxID=1908523 RepID=A0ABW9XD21_9SPHN|nr:methyl-accepting chemotaxis protein [Novosphingobium ovatum]NBC36397.1 methyl-accepting chemotaxis protein [Novosphingobium ovatum]